MTKREFYERARSEGSNMCDLISIINDAEIWETIDIKTDDDYRYSVWENINNWSGDLWDLQEYLGSINLNHQYYLEIDGCDEGGVEDSDFGWLTDKVEGILSYDDDWLDELPEDEDFEADEYEDLQSGIENLLTF